MKRDENQNFRIEEFTSCEKCHHPACDLCLKEIIEYFMKTENHQLSNCGEIYKLFSISLKIQVILVISI